MPATDVFGLTEKIENFTFRDRGGVKILKKWREVAVVMQVDIEIVSVSRTQYVNFSSLPAFGFFGYASLVMRDHLLPPIPLVMPRQTVYYAVNEFAQSAWMEFFQMIRIQENFKGVETLVCTNTGLLGGSCVPLPCEPLPEPSFVEFPLRELFIKCANGTQFKVELSYFELNTILNNCGDLIKPKSNQGDADKDVGLPPDGIAPQQALDNANPFAGLPLVSPSTREGVISSARLDSLNNKNPDNLPDYDGTRAPNYDPRISKWWVIVQRSGGGDCASRGEIAPEDSIPFSINFPPPYVSELVEPSDCPDGQTLYRARVTGGLAGAFILKTSGRYSFYNFVGVTPPP